METNIDFVTTALQTYDWNNPFTFVLVGIFLMFVMRKWGMLLVTLSTIVIGNLGTDLIIMNLTNDQEIISVPIAIYTAGGIIIGIVSILSFTKYTLD